MVDAALIQQCADPGLKPAIVGEFIARAGSEDPLAVTVRSGNRVVLVPKPATEDEAMDLIRKHIGRETIRVGITQYPAGLGILEAGELKPDLVDVCENIRMGSALFARVHRIVLKWYGSPTGEEAARQVFEDAILAWQTGYFEGEAVFRAPDPGEAKPAEPEPTESEGVGTQTLDRQQGDKGELPADAVSSDPNKAGIRIDLSAIGAMR
ncbi:conjugal transfer protein TraH [Rhizobium cremeum]|uniref:TraH family protein n=1 Tax=Rhizobium cremeum TaxID=2813827 RepID=UPI000DD9D6E6|nr:TraH family protein [Rhizobium cremeum]MCJ7997526.1 conjugal transfer protein TraH [Rhizobium cremeum]MCJ8002636.1 conjugal transfer protein TraH [Rhizobium cremeum]